MRLVPDLGQFKKELDAIVKGSAKGAKPKEEDKKKDESKKESSKILSVLKKSLKALGVIALVSLLIGGLMKIFEPILKLIGVVMTLLFIPLIPIMKQVMVALGEFAKKSAKNVSALLEGDIDLSTFFENIFGDVGTLIEQITPIMTEFFEETFAALSQVVLDNAGKIAGFILKIAGQIALSIGKAAFGLGVLIGEKLVEWAEKFGSLIGKFLGKIVVKIGTAISDFIIKVGTSISNFILKIKGVFVNIVTKIRNVWSNFIDKIRDAIAGIIDRIKNFFSLGRGRNETTVGDAIIRPNGQIIRTDPRDTLIATKNPEDLGGQGVFFTFAPVINLPGPINSSLDVRKVAEEIATIAMDELSRRTGGLRI